MANQSPDKDAMIAQAAKAIGMNPQTLKTALGKDSGESLLNSLPPQDAAALRALLADQASLEKLMKSPQAQALLRMLGGK